MAFDWQQRFREQRSRAKARGIAFELTFEQWLTVWKKSGKLRQRGWGGYVMARKGDRGPYAVGNVKIITHGENTSEATLGRKVSKVTRDKIAKSLRGVKHTDERRKNQSLAHLGQKPEPKMLKRRNASIRKALADPAFKAAQSERMTAWWAERRKKV